MRCSSNAPRVMCVMCPQQCAATVCFQETTAPASTKAGVVTTSFGTCPLNRGQVTLCHSRSVVC